MEQKTYEKYGFILREELVAAVGCTEPIAIAYAAANAKAVLGALPSVLNVHCSGNIIKNAKSVIVPNTGGLKGIEASALVGVVGGNASLGMQVLSHMDKTLTLKVRELLEAGICHVTMLDSDKALHIIVEASSSADQVTVEIQDSHTNIVKIAKNGQVVLEKAKSEKGYQDDLTDRTILNVDDIYLFAETVDLRMVDDLIGQQIAMNMAIAEEGMNGHYGVNIGAALLSYEPNSIFSKMKALTASASEARMSGCSLPVITNSGSGNQGIASSVPVIVYARAQGISSERLIRALVLSNLLTIHQKAPIGRLSAFCGVVSAACSSGAAVTYLAGGSLEQIKMTITNTLANVWVSCDGAKPSCGIKIAASLDAAILAHLLAMNNQAYLPGDGLVKCNIEDTILSVGRVAREGMKKTDEQILKIMLEGTSVNVVEDRRIHCNKITVVYLTIWFTIQQLQRRYDVVNLIGGMGAYVGTYRN